MLPTINKVTPINDKIELKRKPVSTMERLETQSQPYIVGTMAIVAAVRTMYIFTDKLVNLTQWGVVNVIFSGVSGLLLAVVSELSISIAGRRHKRYKTLLYQAKMAQAVAKKKDRDLWEVEVKKLTDSVAANLFMMRVAMGMSLYAAASYLIDSIGATGVHQAGLFAQGIATLSAVAIAGYVLYLMYYHGVQTDEITEDLTESMAIHVEDALARIRVDALERIRGRLDNQELSVPAELALIASGLPITSQRLVMPTVKLLLGAREDRDDDGDNTATWWNMKQLALACGENFASGRKADDITRKYRRRCADNAEKYQDDIRIDTERGYIVNPDFAKDFWGISDDAFMSMFTTSESEQ